MMEPEIPDQERPLPEGMTLQCGSVDPDRYCRVSCALYRTGRGECERRPVDARTAREALNAISSMIDATYPTDIDAEAHRWRRCAKVSEEVGEVIEALLGLAGENPRKGVTHTLLEVRKELLDVAVAALGAVAHLDGNNSDPLADLATHLVVVRARLANAIATR